MAAVTKNLIVRVGGDFSGLISSAKKGAAAVQSFAGASQKGFASASAGANVLGNVSAKTDQVAVKFKTATSSILSFAKSAVAIGSVGMLLRKAVDEASNLAEVQNVVSVAFGDLAGEAENFTRNQAELFGLSELQAKKFSGNFMAMGKSLGVPREAAAEMAIELTKLSGDVASFYNINQDAAYTKLKSVFTGETESLKELGVVMNQANLEAYAASQGISGSFSKLDGSAQTLLRYGFVLDALADAQGDFARTADSWANNVRTLQNRFGQFLSVIGTGIIAIVNPFVTALNSMLSAANKVAGEISDVFASLFGTGKTTFSGGGAVFDTDGLSSGVSDALAGISSAADDSSSSLAGIGDSAKKSADQTKKAMEEASRQLFSFDKITKISSKNSDDAAKKAAAATKKPTSSGSSGASSALTKTVEIAGNSMIEQAAGSFSEFQKKFAEAVRTADFTEIGGLFGQKLKSGLDSIDWAPIQATTAKIAKSVATFFNGTIETEGLGKSLGKTLGEAANTGFTLFNEFVGNFHWNSLGFLISNGVYNALVAFDWGQATAAWTNWIAAKWQFVAGLIEGINWRALPGDLFNAAKEALSGIQWGKLLGAGSELAGAVLGAGLGLVAGVVDGISDAAASAMVGVFSSVIGFFSDAFKNAGENPTILSVGKNIISGVWNGITGALTSVGTWITDNVLKPFITGFKNAFGIHSPASNPELLTAAGYVGQGILNGIAAPFRAVAGWVQENIFSPIKNALGGGIMTATVTLTAVKDKAFDTLSTAWNAIKDKAATWTAGVADRVSTFKTATWDALASVATTWTANVSDKVSDWKTAIWDKLAGKTSTWTANVSDKVSDWKTKTWDKLAGKTSTWTASVSDKVSDWKTKTWDKLAGKTSTWTTKVSDKVSDWKTKTWDALKSKSATFTADLKGSASSGLASLKKTWDSFSSKTATFTATFKDSFSAGIKSAWNGIATGINSAITTINKIPGVSIKSVPKLATGGITNGATLAEIGEAGREAVLPLDRNTDWMDTLADKIADRSGGSAQVGQGRPIVVQVVLDGRVVGQTVVDYVHAQGSVGNYPLAGYA